MTVLANPGKAICVVTHEYVGGHNCAHDFFVDGVGDGGCFKCYRRSVLETIHFDKVKFVGYAFQIEMKFDTWKYGFKIKEVPIIFTDRTRGTSKMSSGIFKEAVMGVMMLKISSWFRKYDRTE